MPRAAEDLVQKLSMLRLWRMNCVVQNCQWQHAQSTSRIHVGPCELNNVSVAGDCIVASACVIPPLIRGNLVCSAANTVITCMTRCSTGYTVNPDGAVSSITCQGGKWTPQIPEDFEERQCVSKYSSDVHIKSTFDVLGVLEVFSYSMQMPASTYLSLLTNNSPDQLTTFNIPHR